MRKILFSVFTCLAIASNAQEIYESYTYAQDEYIEQCVNLPVVREINGGTVFNITYDGNWNYEMRGAFEYACKIWEESMPTSLPINIVAKIGKIRDKSGNKPISKVDVRSMSLSNFGSNETVQSP
ncbi:MAG: hypothetical protein NC117_07345 [Pseudoflavonifractor sp.]|nr:hypothetical protein [Pseudoflavonifractor sp.]